MLYKITALDRWVADDIDTSDTRDRYHKYSKTLIAIQSQSEDFLSPHISWCVSSYSESDSWASTASQLGVMLGAFSLICWTHRPLTNAPACKRYMDGTKVLQRAEPTCMAILEMQRVFSGRKRWVRERFFKMFGWKPA